MYRPLYSLMAALSLTASLGACADEPTPLTAPTRGPIPVGPGLPVSLGPISADPAPLTFPATVWHQPRLDTLTVTNSGSNVATIGNVSVSGPNAFDFELAVINGDTPDCGGALQPGAKCFIGVHFSPRPLGSARPRSTSPFPASASSRSACSAREPEAQFSTGQTRCCLPTRPWPPRARCRRS